MIRRRVTIAGIMAAVAFAAVDCSLTLAGSYFFGGLLLAFALQAGLLLMLCSSGRWRRFWAGFESTGIALLLAYTICHHFRNDLVVSWPALLYRNYRGGLSRLPPETVDWLLRHFYIFDPEGNLTALQAVMVLEVTWGLPMMLVAVIGGLLAARLGSRPVPGPIGPRGLDARP